jgi:hypothetical protein
VVYGPIIKIAYLYLDDWGVLIPGGRPIEFYIDFGLMQGRILGSFFGYIFIALFKSSESTRILRLIGIIFLTLFAFVAYVIFKRCRFKSIHAFLISTFICILPSSQIIVSWASSISFIFSAAMSSLSALICFDVTSKMKYKEPMHRKIWTLAAIILLVSALNIYQTSAMMYWAMGVIFFLTMDNCILSNKDFRQFFLRYFLVGLISCALYYLVFMKLVPAYFYPHITLKGGGLNIFDYEFLSMLKWFITKPLKHAMNLWNLNQNKYFAIFISAIIFIGIIFNAVRNMRENKSILLSNYITKYIIISFLVLLSYLPHLILHTGNSYRYMIALTPALSILFCFSLISIVEYFSFIPKLSSRIRTTIISILLIIVVVIAGFSAHSNVNNFAMLHSNEFKYVKNALADYGVVNILGTSKIYFRRARYLSVPVQYHHNEFQRNIITHSRGGYIYPAFYSIRSIEQGEIGATMVRYVIMLALHEIGIKQDLHIIELEPDDPVPEDKNVLFIDMLKFQSKYPEIPYYK